jgi:hypothetical protein
LALVTVAIVMIHIAQVWPAEKKKERKIPPPVEVVQRFIHGVVEKKKGEVEKAFDFWYAYQDLSAKTESVGIDYPWSFEETKETLFYHFLDPERIKSAKEHLGGSVVLDQKIVKKEKTALVTIKHFKDREKANLDKVYRVVLKLREDAWMIVEFPDFYPLDPYELLTGVKQF